MDSRVDRGGQANLVPEDEEELVLCQGWGDVALQKDGEARHSRDESKVSSWK